MMATPVLMFCLKIEHQLSNGYVSHIYIRHYLSLPEAQLGEELNNVFHYSVVLTMRRRRINPI